MAVRTELVFKVREYVEGFEDAESCAVSQPIEFTVIDVLRIMGWSETSIMQAVGIVAWSTYEALGEVTYAAKDDN